jgi:hypothetical protein
MKILKIHTLRVHDSSGESKTAEKLLALLESVIVEAETTWGVKVVAVCTDASGESRKARKLLKAKFPHLVTPDCYAHQVDFLSALSQHGSLTTFRSILSSVTSSSHTPLYYHHRPLPTNSSPGCGARARSWHSYVTSVESSG